MTPEAEVKPLRRFRVEEARAQRWSFTVHARDEAHARELAGRWVGFDDESVVTELSHPVGNGER